MVIFHSYVSLPEGSVCLTIWHTPPQPFFQRENDDHPGGAALTATRGDAEGSAAGNERGSGNEGGGRTTSRAMEMKS